MVIWDLRLKSSWQNVRVRSLEVVWLKNLRIDGGGCFGVDGDAEEEPGRAVADADAGDS